MPKQNHQTSESRRRFLRTSLAASAGAAAAVVTAGEVAASATEPASPNSQAENKVGYRETQHVADYYRTAAL